MSGKPPPQPIWRGRPRAPAWLRFWSTSIQGEGPNLAIERPIESFDAISLEGGWELDVRVGELTSVVVQADENLHEYIATEVVDGRLRIRFLESVSKDR